MKLSVELTCYPFNDTYIPKILDVIEYINSFVGVEVKTFPTATIISGEFDVVSNVIHKTVAWSYEQFGQCVFVAKYIPGKDVLAE